MSASVSKQSRQWLGSRSRRRSLFWGLLLISPWLIGFLVFTINPLVLSLYHSFTRYGLLEPPRWIGPQNYIALFTTDPHFATAVMNTLFYVGISAPLGVVTAFLMATLLNTKLAGRSFYRAIFFFPSMVPAIVTATVWEFLLNVQYGAVNATLKGFGMSAIPFLSNPGLAKPTLILIHLWAQGGAIVTFLASLQDVPRALYEAATVDGAGAWHKFWHITIPLCTPVILFNLITAFIGGFQNFTLPWLLTQGGPNQATEFYTLYLYRNAFSYLRMGKASALAWILFIVIVAFTFVLFKSSARWVYYGGED